MHRANAVWKSVRWLALAGLAVLAAACARAEQAEDSLASYRAIHQVRGEIRIWASPEDKALLEALQAGFVQFHPEAHFRNTLHGPESTFAGVYTDVADLALMARELREPLERMAYEWVKLGKPFRVEIANAGLHADRRGTQLAVMVHRDNPVSRLTLAQLDAILGAERRRGYDPLRTWGDLGVDKRHAALPIRVYGPRVDSIPAQFVRTTVMENSRKWNPDYREIDSGDGGIVDALAEDPAGLALAPARLADHRVKVLALAVDDHSTAYRPEARSIVRRDYPLTRGITMAFAHSLEQPVRGRVVEFLRFVLSREGQAIIAREGTYLPLDAEHAAGERDRLGDPLQRHGAEPAVRTVDAGAGERRPAGPRHIDLPNPDLPPAYEPRVEVAGSIRIWGHGSYGAHTDFVEGLTRAWQDGFRRHHPRVTFDNRLHGTASAIGALYTGTGDLAFLGREIWEPEIAAFREVRGYAPTGIEVLTGSFDVRNKGYALSVFVHRDNPLTHLTLAQLDAIFGVDRLRGHGPVRTWGDVGLAGEWRDRPVRLYGLPIARGFADYFQDAVFLGARKWNPSLREFADEPGSRGGETDGGHKMLQAMASDPQAIGYAGMLYRHPDVRPIALATEPGAAPVMPTLETVADHRYPLTRLITMFVDRPPNGAVDPKVAEFLRYILSREGQQAVLDHGQGYLPVPAAHAERQLRKLD